MNREKALKILLVLFGIVLYSFRLSYCDVSVAAGERSAW